MARAIWSGTLSFGLVSIPVRLYPATSPRDVRFHQFERGTGRRIKYRRVAGPAPDERPFAPRAEPGAESEGGPPDTPEEPFGRTLQETEIPEAAEPEVAFDDVMKGFELDEGRYVMVGPEELEALEPERTRTIDIEHFVSLAEIDPIYFDRSYYLAPQRGAERPYELLLEAMRRAGRVAIARFVLRTRQHLAAIRAMDDVVVLNTLFYADEIRELKEIGGIPTGVAVEDRELDLADKLIGILETNWEPSSYRDEYRDRVLELIEGKARAEGTLAVPDEQPEPASRIPELLEALKASLEQARGQNQPEEKRKARSPKKRRTG